MALTAEIHDSTLLDPTFPIHRMNEKIPDVTHAEQPPCSDYVEAVPTHDIEQDTPPALSTEHCSTKVDDNLEQTSAHHDVIIIGAGLSGISALHRARKMNLKVQVFEAGQDLGGVWHWNRYPGARVDSEYPFYQLNIPESYKKFDFSQRFPDHHELRRYMTHLKDSLDLSRDIAFNSPVCAANYNMETSRWTVKTSNGHTATAKYLVLATGLLHKKYTPDLPGLDRFKGEVYHSSAWPDNASFSKKRVVVVGAGATAVQIVQELAKETSDGGRLSMLMRRPSTCVPMHQRSLSREEQENLRAYFPALFREGRRSVGGFPIPNAGCNLEEHTPEQRETLFEELWARGAFNFLVGNYCDVAVNPVANRAMYDFWAKKVRARVSNPVKRDLVAPLEPIYPIGSKRPPLENDFYECIDMDHVDIVDLNATPIASFTEDGLLLENVEHEQPVDAVVLATGFDSFTGSITAMGLHDKNGVDIKNIWKDGVRTYLGILMNGFPNAFMLYSPQAPTAFSNGPTIIESQADFIFETIAKSESEGLKSVEPSAEAEDQWAELINTLIDGTLLKDTASWWNAGNIPGKKRQVLTYAAGIDHYEATCREKLNGWQGFIVERDGSSQIKSSL